MAIIKQLSEKMANMIAAGEVVDRPASVIKELVENSIDAKANIIKIEVNDFGLSLIRVTDNGIGMEKEDAILAFYRHATSKISDEGDLSHINSLGFRGEALPSISSVSKVLLQTKVAGKEGVEIYLEGSKKIKEGITSMNEGTIISVMELFYNTPARFKYIKSDNAEKNAIIDTFNVLAMSYPNISFKLFMDNVLIKETYGNSDMGNLLSSIYGKEIAKDYLTVSDTIQKIKISLYLANPKHTKSRKKDINIFINRRYIKNYLLTNAVVLGYHSFLMNNRYPIALVYIDIDPSLVDVNVHPQKLEVKLVNEYLLSYHLTNLINNTLKGQKLELTSVKVSNLKDVLIESLDLDYSTKPTNMIINEEKEENIEPSLDIKESKLPFFEYIGSLGGTYLLFQNSDGLFLIDQHAAAERVRYEKILKEFKKSDLVIKNMLVPRTIYLDDDSIRKINEFKPVFNDLGFIFNDENQVIGIPAYINEDQLDETIEFIIKDLEETNQFDPIKLRDDLAKSISCKGAIKANKSLTKDEISKLISDLKTLDNPYTCPHGRPTIIKLTYYEIEKLFKRIL